MDGIALVTGASSGIGRAIARRLVGDGWTVVAAARREQRLEALRGELGDRLVPLALDVTDHDAVATRVARVATEVGPIALLVNNAGLALGTEPAHLADPGEWARMIEVNCTGLVVVTRAVLPAMVDRGRGHVVMLGSTAGTVPYRGGNVYGATKAFVGQFAANLRVDLHGTGVRVTNVEPGIVSGAEFSEVRYRGDEEAAAQVYAGFDATTVEDIADAVGWVVAQPTRVDVTRLEVVSTDQAPAGWQVHRES